MNCTAVDGEVLTLPNATFPQDSYTAPSGAVLFASGAGSAITAAGLALTAQDSSGAARGLLASAGGSITAAGTVDDPFLITISTTDAVGALAESGSSITLSHAVINGSRGSLGGAAASGAGATITLIDTTILATDPGGYGVAVLDGGHVVFRGGTISSFASALRTQGGGVIDATDVDLTVRGSNAIGVNVNHGTVNMTGGSVTTLAGTISHGMNAASSTNSIINADGVTIMAAGGNGINVGNSSHVSFKNGAISSAMNGVRAIAAGTATLDSSTVVSTGDVGFGLYSTGTDSAITAKAVTVSTPGQSANGVRAELGGSVILVDGTVTTTGFNPPRCSRSRTMRKSRRQTFRSTRAPTIRTARKPISPVMSFSTAAPC